MRDGGGGVLADRRRIGDHLRGPRDVAIGAIIRIKADEPIDDGTGLIGIIHHFESDTAIAGIGVVQLEERNFGIRRPCETRIRQAAKSDGGEGGVGVNAVS